MNNPLHADWQSARRTPLNCAKHLLVTGLFADSEFLVGGNHGDKEVLSVSPIQYPHLMNYIFFFQIIKAHKTFLAMRSPVFETMFYGSLPQPQPITIPDIQPEVFKHLLQ